MQLCKQKRGTIATISLIDLIFTSNLDNIQCHGKVSPIADHDGIFLSFHCVKSKTNCITKTIFDYKNIDEMGLRNYIKIFDFKTNGFSKHVTKQAEAISIFFKFQHKHNTSLLKI